mmetsp:Transcript_5854/g.19423  ORF Transcript_5854/g.19423 Transcript_5854/m.19423 type:complete len:238 (+) Transcript_5854:810-1523(+)
MHVIQKHPPARFGVLVKHAFRDGFLALAHADHGELAVVRRFPQVVRQSFDFFRRRVPGEQDEENGRGRAGFRHHCFRVKRVLVDVLAAHDSFHELRKRPSDPVRSDRPHEHEFLEIGKFRVPLPGKRFGFAPLVHAPLRPLLARFLHVPGQTLKRAEGFQTNQGDPLRFSHPLVQVIGNGRRGRDAQAVDQTGVLLRPELPVLEQDGKRQQRGDDEFVLVEQTSSRVVVHREGCGFQ